MTEDERVRALVAAMTRRPMHLRVLGHVAALGLPDGWVAAGFVRNAVWDDLHGHIAPAPLADVDVVYFDRADTSPNAEQAHQARLLAAAPEFPWSVKNQARMHLRNGDPPYADTAQALTCWPETCTAVAVRLRGRTLEVLAPCGLGDLFALRVRPTPRFHAKLDAYRARVAAKAWEGRWPRLRVEHMG